METLEYDAKTDMVNISHIKSRYKTKLRRMRELVADMKIVFDRNGIRPNIYDELSGILTDFEKLIE